MWLCSMFFVCERTVYVPLSTALWKIFWLKMKKMKEHFEIKLKSLETFKLAIEDKD
jgi:hypothetical protein